MLADLVAFYGSGSGGDCVVVSSASDMWQNDTLWTEVTCCDNHGVDTVLCTRREHSNMTSFDVTRPTFYDCCT